MSYIDDGKSFMEKAAGYGSILGLSTIYELMDKLHNPQDDLAIIHVAGTNGKGSVTCFLSNILMKAGYKVGVYTSPAVFSEFERYRINGNNISQEDYYTLVNEIAECSQHMTNHPTIFEVETALAYLYFARQQVDFAIIEVGMGGAEDATNIMKSSLCSIFTSIGRDHMQFLGNTLKEIASVKAGIMRQDCQAVSIWQEESVESVLRQKAKDFGSNLTFATKDKLEILSLTPISYNYGKYKQVSVNMMGTYQVDNSILVLEVVEALKGQGIVIPDSCVYEGIATAKWPGRMECISTEPLVYMDGAHNYPAACRLLETIERNFTNKSITYIIGILGDKERMKMLEILLPKASDIITITPQNARGYNCKSLAEDIKSLGYEAYGADSISEAYEEALNKGNDIILAFGSLSYLKDFAEVVGK